MKKIYFTAFMLSLAISFLPSKTAAQTTESEKHSNEIAAVFNKTKHKVKEKKGVRVEVHIEIKSEPVVKQNVSEYSGKYKSETDDWFDLKVGANGVIEASGTEPSADKTLRFKLVNAKIENALLTATKVYEDGSTEKFEAAFLNRTINLGQNGAPTTMFGLGVVFDPPKTNSNADFVINKLFYELK